MSEFDGKKRNAEVDVDVGEWARADHEQRLVSRGAGPCTIFTIHNRPAEIGYMGHFPGIIDYLWAVAEMVAKAKEEGDPAQLKVKIRGGSPLQNYPRRIESSIAPLYTGLERELVIRQLVEAGIPRENIDAQWLDDPDRAVDAILVCQSGDLEVEEYSVSETLGIDPHALGPYDDGEGDE